MINISISNNNQVFLWEKKQKHGLYVGLLPIFCPIWSPFFNIQILSSACFICFEKWRVFKKCFFYHNHKKIATIKINMEIISVVNTALFTNSIVLGLGHVYFHTPASVSITKKMINHFHLTSLWHFTCYKSVILLYRHKHSLTMTFYGSWFR